MSAYIVFTRTHTRNSAQLDEYTKQIPKFTAGHSIRWLAQGPCETAEGAPVESLAILEFPTLAEARAWYTRPAYQSASMHRYQGGDYNAVIIEGASDPSRHN
jgi:uncharacterized protein (DUF1330 family)